MFLLVLALVTVTVDSTAARASVFPVVVAGDSKGECPSHEDTQAALQLLRSRTEQIVQDLQSYNSNPNCGPGLWRRVFNHAFCLLQK